MSSAIPLPPTVIGRLSEQQVLRVIQARGAISRAEVARESGLSAPTVSKAAAALLKAGLIEETEAAELTRGRPAPRLRLATTAAQVLGIAIDMGHCDVVSAGLDGTVRDDAITVPTPETYAELVRSLEDAARQLIARPGVTTLGVGVSLPGLVDYRQECGVLSPNVAITNGHRPAADLAERLGVDCVLIQELHALSLAEWRFGSARGLDDFALLDVGAGVGLGVMSGGRLLKGRSGLAGELGHFTAVPSGGRRCGCGNTGCLETVASDSALAWHASQKLGRPVNADEVIGLAKSGAVNLDAELREVAGFVAVGIAAVINLLNPSTVLVHTPLFDIDERLFTTVVDRTRERALPPSFAECTIVRARSSKRQGAVAGVIQHLTDSLGPKFH